jgi:hypothetical protein
MRLVLVSLALLTPAPLSAQTQAGGYETYAVVGPTTDKATALPFAQQHCGKYGRFPDFRRMDGSKAIFDCTVQRREKKVLGVRPGGILRSSPSPTTFRVTNVNVASLGFTPVRRRTPKLPGLALNLPARRGLTRIHSA